MKTGFIRRLLSAAGKGRPPRTLAQIYGQFLEHKKAQAAAGMIRPGTLRAIMVKHKNIMRFLHQSGMNDMPADGFTALVAEKMTIWCAGRGYCPDYSQKHIKAVREVYQFALMAGELERSPLHGHRCKWDAEIKTPELSPDDLRRLETSVFLPAMDYLNRERLRFLAMVYTGLSFCDLEQLPKLLHIDSSGQQWIIGRREKTGVEFTVPVCSKMAQILDRYPLGFPRITNQVHNRHLKRIGYYLGLSVTLTSRIGRRTCGQILIDYSGRYEEAAAWLGHSSVTTTERHYARIKKQALTRHLAAAMDHRAPVQP